jgi:hypothetical protein
MLVFLDALATLSNNQQQSVVIGHATMSDTLTGQYNVVIGAVAVSDATGVGDKNVLIGQGIAVP